MMHLEVCQVAGEKKHLLLLVIRNSFVLLLTLMAGHCQKWKLLQISVKLWVQFFSSPRHLWVLMSVAYLRVINVMFTAERVMCVCTSAARTSKGSYIPSMKVTCSAFHLCTQLVQAASGSSLDYLRVIARWEEGREARNKINTLSKRPQVWRTTACLAHTTFIHAKTSEVIRSLSKDKQTSAATRPAYQHWDKSDDHEKPWLNRADNHNEQKNPVDTFRRGA